jgi:single-strand DNA-binding protein
MSGSVNKVILVGNLGRDPEVRRLNSGEQVVNIRVATSETWRDKSTGERRERTEWHNVVIFNEQIGKIVEKYTTEVVLQRYRGELTLLDSRGGGADSVEREDRGSASFGRTSPVEKRPAMASSGGEGPIDDDIPF